MFRGVSGASKHLSSMYLVSRHLSSAQTKAALKPFYFAVHPDLFGQYPVQRSVNEDSLKRLNSYLENLQKKNPVNPTHLLFYLKNDSAMSLEADSELFKTVRVSLFSRDLHFTISHILKTCGMLEELVGLQQNRKEPPVSVASPYVAPYHWLHVYNQFRDRQTTVDLAQLQKNARNTLWDFLDNNIVSAKEKQKCTKAIHKENELLSEKLRQKLKLKSLECANGWSCLSYQGSLKNFLKLCSSRHSELQTLNNHAVVFTNWTGVDPLGRVMLNTQDAPQFWLSLLNSLEDYSILVNQVPAWERRLSCLLGDMKIVFDKDSPSVSVTEYLNFLYRLSTSLRTSIIDPGQCKELIARILSPSDSLSLSLSGEFRIPPSAPADLIVKFVLKHKQKATELYIENERNCKIEEQAVQACKEKYKLSSLSRDLSVSPLQMSDCCERLMKQDYPDLNESMLIVSKYYHVNEDGDVHVPWNWK